MLSSVCWLKCRRLLYTEFFTQLVSPYNCREVIGGPSERNAARSSWMQEHRVQEMIIPDSEGQLLRNSSSSTLRLVIQEQRRIDMPIALPRNFIIISFVKVLIEN